MALTSTLFTGLSGLSTNQARLNVVGNNIANVNTVAYKSSRVLFKPQFYVTDSAGGPATADFGGQNPSQRGLGATVAAIEKNFATGTIEPTGRVTDFAIDGDGFFIVQSNEQKFTRDGSFTLNSSNQLVTSGGDFVQGYGVDDNYNVITGQLRNIVIPLGAQASARQTNSVVLEGNLNASGSTAVASTVLSSAAMSTSGGTAPVGATLLTDLRDAGGNPLFNNGDVLTLAGRKGGRSLPDLTFAITPTSDLSQLMAFFNQGMGIDTSVGGPPTPGVTLTTVGTTAQLTITGNTGTENGLSITSGGFRNQTGATPLAFTQSAAAAGESVHTSFVVYDSLGTPLTVDVTAVLESSTTAGNVWRFYATSPNDTDANRVFDPAAPSPGIVLGTGTLSFDTQGRLAAGTESQLNIAVTRDATGAATPVQLTLDFARMTSLKASKSTLVMTEQDGFGIGQLSSFSVGPDGTITGSFTNGQTRTLGQLAVATFKNPQGLVDKGGNMYTTGSNSGVPIITTPLSLGSGGVRAGSLELSNVDLSAEFINLIVASTGFTAASRVITTSDRLLTELLNTSR